MTSQYMLGQYQRLVENLARYDQSTPRELLQKIQNTAVSDMREFFIEEINRAHMPEPEDMEELLTELWKRYE